MRGGRTDQGRRGQKSLDHQTQQRKRASTCGDDTEEDGAGLRGSVAARC